MMQDKDTDIKQMATGHSSGLRDYARIVVGRPSFWRCLQYEVLCGICSGRDGMVGLGLRRLFYPALLGSVGRGLVMGRNVTLRGCQQITLGRNVLIDEGCVLDARGEAARIVIGDNVVLSRHTIIRARNATITIGSGSDIGCNCLLATDSQLTLGEDILIGAYTYLVGGGLHRTAPDEPRVIQQGIDPGVGITIGDGAWIGTRASLLDGAHIGQGAVIGAHALVTHPIPAMAVAYGAPAVVKRQR
jgi:acetyltransferase-like isoleucine patch superfamily enzyme